MNHVRVNFLRIALKISSSSAHKHFSIGNHSVKGVLIDKLHKVNGLESCPFCKRPLYVRELMEDKDCYCSECGYELSKLLNGVIGINGKTYDTMPLDDYYSIPRAKCPGCNDQITTVISALGDYGFNRCYCGENFEDLKI
jgi:hypothetical protein